MTQDELIKMIAAGVSGGGLSALLGIWSQRKKAHLDILEQVNGAVNTALASLQNEIRRLNRELDNLRISHRHCEERTRVLQEQIDALMSGDVPPYTAEDLRRIEKGKISYGPKKRDEPRRGSPGPRESDEGGGGDDNL